ncbi:branched-chain amino acid ABC transporter substrate-binding protein [Pseudomonas sp. SLFW]|uniref:branched-chain amino acid ABC transporter substrate-binding protein n=1 Tax=Pseudomonas sp. SLFW TaxID=2683259 RepID=UPI00141212CB|nr:ABC transporter substrate-binding protein [Pseudomonas sp. SLFW]
MKIQRILTVSTVFMAMSTSLVQAKDVVLGVAGPATGQYASFFDQITHGAKSAAEAINAAGGINGDTLVLDIQDDACDPKQAVAVANKLAAKKVAGVIGHFCSSSAIPASDVYADSGIPMIASAASNPTLTERGLQNVFRTTGRDDKSAVIAYQAILANKDFKRVAIIHDKSTYGQGLADNVKKGLNAGGLQEVVFDTLTQGEKDFSTLISKLKQANVDLVFFGGYFAEGGLLVRQAREQGLKATFMGGDGIASTEFATIAGPAANGFLMTFYPDPRDNPKAAGIVKQFRDGGYEPEGYTLYTYAAIQAFAAAANNVKSEDGPKVATALHNGTFDTVLGDVKFDKKGDPSTEPFIIYVWEDGKYKPLKK